MKKLIQTILQIVIQIAKRLNKNIGLLIDMIENIYALTAAVKTQTVNKLISILVMIIGGKLIEVLVNNKIVTAIEIIKLINNYITVADVLLWMELWIVILLLIVKIELQERISVSASIHMLTTQLLIGMGLIRLNVHISKSEASPALGRLEIKHALQDTSLSFQYLR